MDKHSKQYRNFILKAWRKRPDVKEKLLAYQRKYAAEHREQIRENDKKFYANHKAERIEAVKRNNVRMCKEPVVGDNVKYNTLIARIKRHKEFYVGVVPKDCIIHIPKIKGIELLSEEQKEQNNIQ